MKTAWLAGKTGVEREEFRAHFVGSKAVRDRLTELLLSKVKATQTTAESHGSYGNPSWAYLQADAIGYQRAMKEVLSLIEDSSD